MAIATGPSHHNCFLSVALLWLWQYGEAQDISKGGAGEVAQWLRMLSTLLEDLLQFQTPMCQFTMSRTLVPEVWGLLASAGTACLWCTDRHAGKAPVHKIKMSKLGENDVPATYELSTSKELLQHLGFFPSIWDWEEKIHIYLQSCKEMGWGINPSACCANH